MKVAIFGGTFDPVHFGHLEAARAAADRFGLDRVLFVAAGRPPHKADGDQAPYLDRLEMLRAACAVDPRFEASAIEDPVKLGSEKAYSVRTIEQVRESLGPEDELFFLLGEDAFRDLGIWHRLGDVVRLVEFIVVSRPGADGPLDLAVPGLRARRLEGVSNPISSSEVRDRIATGRGADGLTPAAVADYIARRGLYARTADGG